MKLLGVGERVKPKRFLADPRDPSGYLGPVGLRGPVQRRVLNGIRVFEQPARFFVRVQLFIESPSVDAVQVGGLRQRTRMFPFPALRLAFPLPLFTCHDSGVGRFLSLFEDLWEAAFETPTLAVGPSGRAVSLRFESDYEASIELAGFRAGIRCQSYLAAATSPSGGRCVFCVSSDTLAVKISSLITHSKVVSLLGRARCPRRRPSSKRACTRRSAVSACCCHGQQLGMLVQMPDKRVLRVDAIRNRDRRIWLRRGGLIGQRDDEVASIAAAERDSRAGRNRVSGDSGQGSSVLGPHAGRGIRHRQVTTGLK